MGTVAPTTQGEFDDLPAALFSSVLWVASAAYTAISLGVVWLALALAPWGLLLLIPGIGTLAAAAILGVIAFGISRLEADPA